MSEYEKVIELHQKLEKVDNKKIQNAKHQKAPATEKEYIEAKKIIKLKPAKVKKSLDIVQLLKRRESVRTYTKNTVSFSALSNILHYSRGIKTYRSNAYNLQKYPVSYSPSAGGLQPLDIYVYVSSVEGVEAGLYYYKPSEDSLVQLYGGRPELDLSQIYLSDFPQYAPINLIITGNIQRFHWKYDDRGYRLLNVDCGILAENISLLAVAENLGSCMLAAYINEKVAEKLHLAETEVPLLCMSVGGFYE